MWATKFYTHTKLTEFKDISTTEDSSKDFKEGSS